MTIADITQILLALGVGGILKALVDRIVERRKGRIAEEQTAWQQRDTEARHRRELEEALHQHRQLWHILDDRPYDEMPPVPEAPKR